MKGKIVDSDTIAINHYVDLGAGYGGRAIIVWGCEVITKCERAGIDGYVLH